MSTENKITLVCKVVDSDFEFAIEAGKSYTFTPESESDIKAWSTRGVLDSGDFQFIGNLIHFCQNEWVFINKRESTVAYFYLNQEA